jgi:DNA-binding Lrp family transcriptional regulator
MKKPTTSNHSITNAKLNNTMGGSNNNKNNTDGNGKERRRRELDSLDMKIIDELLDNAAVSSTAIATKFKVPLSTIQRRRAALESMSIVKHAYSLNPINFGFRPVEFWVLVEKGKAEDLAQKIFNKFENILDVSVHINSISNVKVQAYISGSQQLYSMIEQIKSIPFAEGVEFAETVKVIAERQVNFFKISR